MESKNKTKNMTTNKELEVLEDHESNKIIRDKNITLYSFTQQSV
jgi:hypothetical protein